MQKNHVTKFKITSWHSDELQVHKKVLLTSLIIMLSCSVMSDSVTPMDCSRPGSSVHGIFQVRILEWVLPLMVIPIHYHWATSLIIREMQIKTTVRYQLTPASMIVIENARGNWRTCKGKTAVALWETIWRFLKNVTTELPWQQNYCGNPDSGCIYKVNRVTIWKRYTARYVNCLNVHWWVNG